MKEPQRTSPVSRGYVKVRVCVCCCECACVCGCAFVEMFVGARDGVDSCVCVCACVVLALRRLTAAATPSSLHAPAFRLCPPPWPGNSLFPGRAFNNFHRFFIYFSTFVRGPDPGILYSRGLDSHFFNLFHLFFSFCPRPWPGNSLFPGLVFTFFSFFQLF